MYIKFLNYTQTIEINILQNREINPYCHLCSSCQIKIHAINANCTDFYEINTRNFIVENKENFGKTNINVSLGKI